MKEREKEMLSKAKWQSGKMAKWQSGKVAKWQNGKVAKWQNGKWQMAIPTNGDTNYDKTIKIDFFCKEMINPR